MSRTASGLQLLPAPVFAVLALLNGDAGTEMLCLNTASPLGSMSLMYGLMCALHLGPWLRVIATRTRFSNNTRLYFVPKMRGGDDSRTG